MGRTNSNSNFIGTNFAGKEKGFDTYDEAAAWLERQPDVLHSNPGRSAASVNYRGNLDGAWQLDVAKDIIWATGATDATAALREAEAFGTTLMNLLLAGEVGVIQRLINQADFLCVAGKDAVHTMRRPLGQVLGCLREAGYKPTDLLGRSVERERFKSELRATVEFTHCNLSEKNIDDALSTCFHGCECGSNCPECVGM